MILKLQDAELKRSRFYQEVLAEGREEGRRQEASGLVLRLLRRRFGSMGRLLLLSAVCLPTACGGGLTDAQHVEKAQRYAAEGQVNAAVIELKNALQQNPDNPSARKLLGELHLEVGDAAGAEKELRRARKLGVADDVVLPLLAQALLAQGKQEELQAISSKNLTPGDRKATVLAAQGLAKLAKNEVSAAAGLIEQAVSMSDQSPYARLAKGRLLASTQEYDLAREEVDRVLELDASYAPAWGLLGDLENRGGNPAEAEAAYSKAIEKDENDLAALLKRAQVRILQKKYEEAQKDLDILRKRIPNHPEVNYAQGLIHLQKGRLQEAKAAFDLTLSAKEDHLGAVYFLALTHLRLGNREQAEKYAEQFLSAVPDSVGGRKLVASIELANRQYATAEELIRPVVDSRGEDTVAFNMLATALLGQGKTDEAVGLLKRVTDLQPDSAIAQLRLGAALLAGGRQGEGVTHIEKAIEMDPQLQRAYLLLANFYLRQKDIGKALQAAESYRDAYPDTAAPYNLIGRLRLESGDEASARQSFERARELEPGNPIANHRLAALAIKKKAYQETRGYYQNVLSYQRDHLSTLLKLAALDALEENEQAMLAHLQQAATAHPKAVQPKILLARYYLRQGEPTKVPTLMVELSEAQRRIPAVLEVMARSQLAQKQYAQAKYSLEQLIEQRPDSAQAHLQLARAYAGLGERKGLRSELERAVGLAPKSFGARLALGRLLLLEGEKEAVAEQLSVLDELSPEHPDVLRLKAALARAQGDQATATELLEAVFEKSPTTASMLSVARQQWATGEETAALELQEEWVAEHPDDLAAAMALAATNIRQGQVDRAMEQYQRILGKQEKNVAVLNNLAWLLSDREPKKALEYAERASELAPEAELVMDTLAVVLLKNDDIARAKRTMERVLAKDPKNPAFRYHGAMIDAAAGEKVSAIQALEALLGAGSDFAEQDEAQQLLTKLQAGG
jgi:putative PEP-CTERM system TPR-repeat lipoprotein